MPAEPIAIIGTSCRFPGDAISPSRLWELLKHPRDVASAPPPTRFDALAFYHKDAGYPGTGNSPEAYFLSEDPRCFDAPFFNISSAEAGAMDPQHRQLLEAVFESLEAAGLRLDQLRGSSTGVFCGQMSSEWGELVSIDFQAVPPHAATGGARSILANRVSYFFDWHGPSVVVDTACSSSMVALHQAVTALQQQECPVAIAAGVNLLLTPNFFITTSKMTMLSPDGRGRMWDANANGYARGEGVASIVLKRLSDAVANGDPIECVIKGTGVNQDGRTLGLTMPSGTAQRRLIESTYARAGLDPRNPRDRCQYFEAHGTGTLAGDPQEASAIHGAFFGEQGDDGNSHNSSPLYVGSIKTIVGHTEGLAGLAGIIKASLSIQNRTITPNLLFETLNPALEPFIAHLKVPTEPMAWPALARGVPRRVSVNSFGFGGTNAHAILESYEPPESDIGLNGAHTINGADAANGLNGHTPVSALLPFVFSAVTAKKLATVLSIYQQYLRDNPATSLMQLAATLIERRSALTYRLALTASTADELLTEIDKHLRDAQRTQMLPFMAERARAENRRLVGVFTGQGAQWPQMGADLITSSPTALKWIGEMQQSLDGLPSKYRPSFSLLEELSNASAPLHTAGLSQPLCTALQIILVRFLKSLGVSFDAIVGHSSGEIAAAYAAGFLTMSDAIRIAYLRGFVASQAGAGDGQPGAMMAVGMSSTEAVEICNRPEFKGRVMLAASNAPSSVTLSGDADAIHRLEEELKEENKFARLLRVDTAYHSHHMLLCSSAYREALNKCNIQIHAPGSDTKWYSSVYPGVVINLSKSSSSLTGEYWIENMVSQVSFTEAVEAVVTHLGEPSLVIEVGPHPALKGPAQQTFASVLPVESDVPYVGALERGSAGVKSMASAIGRIWGHLGPQTIDVTSYARLFNSHWKIDLVKDLPSYPFSHEKAYTFHKRLVNHHLFKRGPPNILIGSLEPTSGDREWRWHNYLKSDILPWLSGHQIQSQTVFPAAGYISMAFEAASVVCGDRPIRQVRIEDFVIRQAIVMPEDDPIGIETLFRLAKVTESKVLQSTVGEFQIDATTGDSLQTRASGRLTILWGQPDTKTLARGEPPPCDAHPVDPNDFYAFLSTLGYGYTGPFRGIQSLTRKKDLAFGELCNDVSFGHSTPVVDSPGPQLHPVVLDSALQVVLASLGAPGDGEIYTLMVPTSIKSIVINPVFCGASGTAAAGKILSARGECTKLDSDGFSGDCDIFTQDGHGLVQIAGVEVSPLQQPLDRRQLFSKLVVGPIEPKDWILPPRSSEITKVLKLSELIIFLYMRFCLDDLTEEDRQGLDWHRQTVVSWMEHTLAITREGKHPLLRREWLELTRDDLDRLLEQGTVIPAARMAAIVYENLIGFIRGETSLLEELRKNDALTQFYKEDTSIAAMNEGLGQLVNQMTFRYPRMKILEIGAGTGSATRAILSRIGLACHSYTFTDISVAFFEDAKVDLEPYEDRMIYKALNIERDPIEQGFEEHSYDLIVASNVLHATKFMKPTMERVRRLLKPGGYLALQEVTNLDMIAKTWCFSTFDGWWAGHEDGRVWGPMVSPSGWDQLLKDTEFSGIDVFTTAAEDERYCDTSLIISQAVDSHIRLLRDPLAFNTDPLTLFPRPTELVVLGGTENWARSLAGDLSTLVESRFTGVIHATSLDSPALLNISDDSSVVVLSMLDLGLSWFDDLNENRLQSMQRLVSMADKMLWVTVGPESERPHYGLSSGWLKSLVQENPKSLYQYFNIDDQNDATPWLVATVLMRLAYTQTSNDFTHPTCLHTTELELFFKDGKIQAVRLQDDQDNNDRYAAVRKKVAKKVDLSSASVNVTQTPDGHHVIQIAEADGRMPCNGVVDYIRVRSRYATVQAVRIANDVFLHLVIGVDENGSRLLCLADQHSSHFQVPKEWTLEVPFEIGEDHDGELLKAVADTVVAIFLVERAKDNSALFVHEAGDVVRKAILSQVSHRNMEVLFTTSRRLPPEGVYELPSTASARALRDILPREISVAACLDLEENSRSIFSHFDLVLSPEVIREAVKTLYRPSVLNPKSALMFGNQLVAKLRDLSPAILGWMKECSSTIGVPANELATQKVSADSIVDWTQCFSLIAHIQPSASLVQLSSQKTYLLAGMAGDFGQSIAQWMVTRGARHIVLASRNPKINTKWIESMARKGARMAPMALDLTSRESVIDLFREIQQWYPPIGGVVNGALNLEDSDFLQTSVDIIQRNMAPKVEGTLFLDELCGPTVNLDFFIVFGSLAGIFGNESQSAYAAAVCFQNNLIHRRRARGLVASIIHLGVVNGIGILARKGQNLIQHIQSTTGSYLLSERDVDRFFAEAIVAGRPESGRHPEVINGMMKRDPEDVELRWYRKPLLWGGSNSSTIAQLESATTLDQVTGIVEASLITKVRSKFSLADDYPLTAATQLRELGMDSLVAVDLRKWLAKELAVEIPLLEILNGGSIRHLTAEAVAALPQGFVANGELPTPAQHTSQANLEHRQHNLVPEVSLASEITHVALAFMHSSTFNRNNNESTWPLFTTVEAARAKFSPGIPIMVAIGGWGDTQGFSEGARTEESRKLFASNIRRMLDDTGADGVDIDWEYPGGNGDDYKQTPNSEKAWEIAAYPEFLAEIRAAIPGKLISAAVPGLRRDMLAFTKETIPSIEPSVDFLNVMAYDLMNRRDNVTKHHTGLQLSLDSINAYLEAGMPAEKLNLGLAYYVKWFKTVSGDQCARKPVGCPTVPMEDPTTGADLGQAGAFSWIDRVPSELSASFEKAKTNGVYDTVGGGYYFWDENKSIFWSWDTPDAIKQKFPQILREKELGGVFAWGLGEDAPEFTHLAATIDGLRETPAKDTEEHRASSEGKCKRDEL
ncbi:uncharacterized protein DSM5745_08393 [Aspergillus mulundensis]|uniref:chitinase n=1 Tax=Aspergillus mulundensis TaxID=1810919 RepID=A0A3D8RA01_9EURO|nr:hypothetical protein DSM5745_08393 [Aspergillus mulundensis]RDW70882.1 hypothetical protein DSM5745_08393 [Aspergillus mulundensis]